MLKIGGEAALDPEPPSLLVGCQLPDSSWSSELKILCLEFRVVGLQARGLVCT